MTLLIFVVFFIPAFSVAENNTCPLYFSGYDGSCMVGSEFQDGDVIFGIMANIHKTTDSRPWCGSLSTPDFELVAMVRWLLRKLELGGYVKGVKFGYRVHDSCHREELVPRGLLALVPQLETENCMASRVVGILDQMTSNQVSSLAAGLRNTNITIPIISTSSTAPSLSNKTDYPTFLRTIQPDTVAVKAMVDVIARLRMKYVVLVHTNDFYGRQGKDLMVAALRKKDICVASTLEVTSDHRTVTRALQDMEARLDKVGKQGILGVVYYGQVAEARELLRQANGLADDRGRQFLWVMSEAVGMTHYIFENREKIRRNILTITPVNIEINEFREYWVDLLFEHIQNQTIEDDFYIRDYIEQLLECDFRQGSCQNKTKNDVNSTYVEPGYAVVTMDAVYAFAAAVKNLHREKCGDTYDGVCQRMREALKTEFLAAVKAVNFTYHPDAFPFIPYNMSLPNSRRTGDHRRVAFNQATLDPLVTESSPSHIIYKYTCNPDCHFLEIAHYQNNELRNWDLERVNFYPSSIEPLAAKNLQPILCTSLCTECHPLLPFAYIPGEFLIAAILPIHENNEGGFLDCNTTVFHSRMLHSVEALLYAVDLFNDPAGDFKDHQLNGRLGAVVFDSCYDGLYAIHRIVELHSGQITLISSDGLEINPDSIVLYVGGHYSSTALRVAPVIEALKLPQLGYAATSVKLFDYPHFLRTIPADDVQARVIIDFVKEMGWQRIAILYQDDSYGQDGFKNLLEFATEAHICISENISIPVHDDVIKWKHFPRNWPFVREIHRSPVVVLFLHYDEIQTILKQVKGKLFTWIGSEAWGRSPAFLEAETGLESLGAITVAPQVPRYERWIENFQSLKPDKEQVQRDPFFATFWERRFRCYLNNSATAEPGWALCNDSLSLNNFGEFYEIISAIKDVSLPSGGAGISSKVFKSRGDGNIGYAVYNVQKVRVDQREEYRYVQVAEYRLDSGLVRNEERVIFYDEHGNEKEVEGTCVNGCEMCDSGMPIWLVTIIAIGGLLFVIFCFILGCCCHQKRTKHKKKDVDPNRGSRINGLDDNSHVAEMNNGVEENSHVTDMNNGVPLPDPPNGAATSVNGRVAVPSTDGSKGIQGSFSENKQMRLDPTKPHNMLISRQFSDPGLRNDRVYSRIGESYGPHLSSSNYQPELKKFDTDTRSRPHQKPTLMYRYHDGLDAHGGAGNHVSSATTSPPYPRTCSLHQQTPDRNAVRISAPGFDNDVTILDPQLLQALLEDVRKTSPDIYQHYVKPGSVAVIVVPTPGEDTESRFAFSNMDFVDEFDNRADDGPHQGARNDAMRDEGNSAVTQNRRSPLDLPNAPAGSLIGRSTSCPIDESRYKQRSTRNSGHMRPHPVRLQSMHTTHPLAHPNCQYSVQSVPRFHPPDAPTVDPYNTSSLSRNQEELANIYIVTGSDKYANNSRIRADIEQYPSLNAHGGAGPYVTPSHSSSTDQQTYCQNLPDKTVRRSAPGNLDDLTLNEMTIFGPQLLQALLEDVRKTSPDIYQHYVKPGSVAAIAVPTPGENLSPRSFHEERYKSPHLVDTGTDSPTFTPSPPPSVSTTLDHSPHDDSHSSSTRHASTSPRNGSDHAEPNSKVSACPSEADEQQSPNSVAAGADSSTFPPVSSPTDTPSVWPTLSQLSQNESHSSVTHTPLLLPSGTGPGKSKPKVPMRPSEVYAHQSPHLIDAGDSSTFVPVSSPTGTPSVSPTLSHSSHNENHSSATHSSLLPPSGVGIDKLKPKVHTRPNKADEQQSSTLVDPVNDSTTFAPISSPKGTPSVSPTLSHFPQNESHSSATQKLLSPPPESETDPAKPKSKPKLPARPSEDATQQSTFQQFLQQQEQNRSRVRLSPTSVDNIEHESIV